MNRETFRKQTIRNEGTRSLPYQDTEDVWTVGVGHNMNNPLSQTAIDQIHNDDMNIAISDAQSFSWWASLNDPRQRAIAGLLYQLGLPRFLKFEKTIGFMKNGDYVEAGMEVRDSAVWRKPETRARIERVAVMIETGFDSNIW